jgi:hypothetical protein
LAGLNGTQAHRYRLAKGALDASILCEVEAVEFKFKERRAEWADCWLDVSLSVGIQAADGPLCPSGEYHTEDSASAEGAEDLRNFLARFFADEALCITSMRLR